MISHLYLCVLASNLSRASDCLLLGDSRSFITRTSVASCHHSVVYYISVPQYGEKLVIRIYWYNCQKHIMNMSNYFLESVSKMHDPISRAVH